MKNYHSAKTVSEDAWQHDRIELLPLNSDYEPTPVAPHEGTEMVNWFVRQLRRQIGSLQISFGQFGKHPAAL